MKKLRLFLLLTLAVVLCPKISMAQMATTMTISAEREILLTKQDIPIKKYVHSRQYDIISFSQK